MPATDAFGIRIVREDDGDGIVGFEAHASNGQFAGLATWWGYVDNLLPLAKMLKGFPRKFGEVIELRFAENCVLVFECVDRVGHVKVRASLSTAPEGVPSYEPNQLAVLTFRSEPAQIDSFVTGLATFGLNKIQIASLGGSAP